MRRACASVTAGSCVGTDFRFGRVSSKDPIAQKTEPRNAEIIQNTLTTYRDACVGKMNTTIVPEAITSASLLQVRDITASSSVGGMGVYANYCSIYSKFKYTTKNEPQNILQPHFMYSSSNYCDLPPGTTPDKWRGMDVPCMFTAQEATNTVKNT